MAAINADRVVMEFFPATKTTDQTRDFIRRMQDQFKRKGYCYFAVDKLADGQFIGFIGLSEQIYNAPFTPCVDIGWRLRQEEWGNGYATEGALRCLDYAFQTLLLKSVVAVSPALNKKSEHIMEKIGMRKQGEFMHPEIRSKELKPCVVYKIKRPTA